MESLSGYLQIQGLIQTRYTRKTYTTGKNPIHHLTALKQPIKNIQNYLDKLDKKRIKEIMKGDPGMNGFTPLHISLFAPFEIFILILNKTPKGEIDAKDQYGWTALHHTVLLTEPEKYEKALLENGADPDKKTDADGTLVDLKRLFGKEVYAPSKKTTTIEIDGKDRKLSEVTEEELFSLTGLKKYTDSSFYPEQYFFKLWKRKKDTETELSLIVKTSYQKWKKRPPFLQIKKKDDQYGLVAGEKISAGTCLGSYVGVYTKERNLDNTYLYGSINAKTKGNATRFSNHGFPNVILFDAILDGVKQKIMIAIEEIGKGEEVVWDYGISFNGTFNDFVLLQKEKISSFFQKKLSFYIQEMDKIKNKKTVDYIVLAFRVTHPLNHPKALLYLHFKNLVSAKEYLELVKSTLKNLSSLDMSKDSDQSFRFWYAINNFKKLIVYSFIKRLAEWEENIQEEKVKKMTSQWILDNIDSFSTFNLLQALKLIQKQCHEKTFCSEEEWKQFFLSLPENLKNYSFVNDEKGFLSPNKIANDLLQIFPRFVLKGIFQITEETQKNSELADYFEKVKDCIINN